MLLTSFTYLYPERPTLLSLQRNKALIQGLSKKEWIAERKYNGSRCVLHYLDGKFTFCDRHGDYLKYTPNADMAASLRDLANKLEGYWIFDGELRHNKTKGISHRLILWDVLVSENHLLNEPPFWVRRSILEDYCTVEGEPIGCTKHYRGEWAEVYNSVLDDEECEGIILKNLKGVLRVGRSSAFDSTWMLKIRKTTGRWQF